MQYIVPIMSDGMLELSNVLPEDPIEFMVKIYCLSKKKEDRLTNGLRLYSPIYSNGKIYAVNTYDGTSNIFEGDLEFKDYKQLTDFKDGTQIFSLSISDSLIIFDAVINHGRKIQFYNLWNL